MSPRLQNSVIKPRDDSSVTTKTGTIVTSASSTVSITSTTSGSEATNTASPKDDQGSNTTQTGSTATESAATQATSASSLPPPSNGLSGGAIAGVAIGCLLLGLALGALAVFIFCRRRGKKRRHHHRPRGEFLAEKESVLPHDSSPTSINLDHFLLDTTPDKEIVSELRALGDLVSMHVDNNYHHQPVQTDPSALAASISKLGFHAASASTIASLCCNPQTRAVGLRHFISHVIFTSIDFSARSPLSMLPAPVAAFLASIPMTEDSTETSLAFSKWRALSAFLLHPNRTERTPLIPSEAATIPQAQGLTSALNTVLSIFVSHRESQVEHLQAVILEFANFGYVLLSQPSDFRFVYKASSQDGGDRAIVVCAGLEKLSRRDGGSVVSSALVRAPEVVRV
ncbi:hypothetical protein EDB81DRAFT_766032 [Dactylonectria macrodidyma]|uniref:Uncharacterized protein n=1 Tax=Dactylonectria macrodidyma TaxID=307937 RepID=A0A9P9DQ90_9HYPO|nr:hypothetical protein EDB81DRAFT_766032 [Dactylonectria macrodidyma]